jgi:predicted patatin/cPLA2 family phospholipase
MSRTADKTALVVEGGGMRGIFAAGVLDAFYEAGFDPFDLYIGTSSGACNLASHLAGQHQRNFRVYTRFMVRPEFFDPRRLLSGGHWMDLDWLWDILDREDRLDVEAATDNGSKTFLVVVTSIRTGLPLYLRPVAENLNDYLKASCSIPIMYSRFPKIHSIPVTDGGVADSIPVVEAHRRGATRIVVIRSRPAAYVQKAGLVETALSVLLLKHPLLFKAAIDRPVSYMRAVDFINHPPPPVRVLQIAPPAPLKTGRTTRDLAVLNEDYDLGKRLGQKAMADWGRLRESSDIQGFA